MLAARDQENLVHGHQAAAASKPLNQGTRQLAPKTPAKVLKTPFKIPFNDENAGGFGGVRPGGKGLGRGDENVMTGTKKGGLTDTFVTPMGPKSRAPLGVKTTNAKAKAFQTPAARIGDNEQGKPNQKSASARKAKPRVSHAEMTKLEILENKGELEEREIEYMPPKVKDMPDLPDDHVELDFSMFKDSGLMRGATTYFATRKGVDGLSHLEREAQRQQKSWDRMDRRSEAALLRNIESEPIPCIHYPECHGELCKDTIQARKEAEERYQQTIAEINAEAAATTKKPDSATRPSVPKSKATATTLTQPKTAAPPAKATSKPAATSVKSRLNATLVSRSKKTLVPTNPSPMRHAAATAASRTTMGYSKGRAASATIRRTRDPTKDLRTDENEIPDTSLAPAVYIQRYGVPRLSSDMWLQCKTAGCFDEDEGPSLEELFARDRPGDLDSYLREEAEQEFQLTL